MHSRFKTLDSFLLENQVYWRSDPFHLCQTQQQPWVDVNRPLVDWLDRLSIENIQILKEQPQVLVEELIGFLPELEEANQSIQFTSTALKGQRFHEVPKMAFREESYNRLFRWARLRLTITTAKSGWSGVLERASSVVSF